MKVAVAGTGYVGLVTGVVLAHIGHNVTCVDIDQNKIDIMKSGKSPIYEEGLEELMFQNKKRLDYTTDYKGAYSNAEVIFVGVGTPEKEDGSANLDYVYGVCKQIAESIEKDCVVVIKSTVPIGTNKNIQEYLNEQINGRVKISVVSNPEFLAQGTAVKDSLHASRIVVGFENEKMTDFAGETMRKLYQPLTKGVFNVPYLEMNWMSAEMVKYASNNFLALKLSYINEIANLSEALGANISDVAQGMGLDSRIGNKFLQAGIGYGGSCFPKDTKALYYISKELGEEAKTIKACIEVNEKQKERLIEKIKKDFGASLEGKKIAVLGVTFKPNTDDLREAPSIPNVEILLGLGAEVTVFDPVGLDNFKKIFGDRINYESNIESCLKGKDIALIMTEWDEVKYLNLDKFEKLMKTPNVYDGRNCYSLKDVRKLSLNYYSIGRENIKK